MYLYENRKNSAPELNVWCAYPAVYNFGMSALGFLKVFQMIDETEGVLSERIFTDSKTSYIQYKNIDLIAFSVSFEFDYTGVLKILEKYKIPFLSKDRDETHPLILGGGPVLSANPEPFSAFYDFIITGDAEPHLKEVLEFLKRNKNLPKKEKLKRLKDIESIYVPALKSEKIKKAVSVLDDCTSTPILTENSFFPDTYIIEIERGCPMQCRFCLTSKINHPVRFAPYEKIIEKIDEGLKYTNKLALLGAMICAHPKIDDICRYITAKAKEGRNIEVSVSSLRADAVSDAMLEMLKLCGQKNVTIAVEAGSERLRNLINKRLKKEDVLSLADKLVKFGFSGLKIYGMTGLPSETYEDLDEFISLLKEIKKKGLNVIPSFSSFVPKAHTPFQYASREDTKSLEKKCGYLKKNLAKIGIKARFSSPKWDYIQSLLSRGAGALTPYLIDVYKAGADLGAYKRIYKEYEKQGLLPPSDSIALNEQPLDAAFPWDFIEYSFERRILEEEYKRAFMPAF